MSIFKNVRKVRAVIAQESVDDFISPAGSALNTAAMAAIAGGINSAAWKSYMAVFADNPQQLARLTVQADGEDPYIKQMRTYMVTAGVCDPGTSMGMPPGFDERIDTLDTPVPETVNDADIINLRPEALRNIR